MALHLIDSDVVNDLTTGGTADVLSAQQGVALLALINGLAASGVSFSNAASGLVATTVQGAIDEVEARVDTLEAASHAAVTLNLLNNSALSLSGQELRFNPSAALSYSNGASGLAATSIQAAIDEVAASFTSVFTYVGVWDASGGAFPTITGVGKVYTVSVAATFAGIDWEIGDRIVSNVAAPGTTAGDVGHWDRTKAADDQTAAQVPFTNTTSGLTATTVQAAIDEIDATVDGLSNIIIVDADGDTSVAVEATADSDEILMTTFGTARTRINAAGLVQDSGDLEVITAANGLIMNSGAQRWRITITATGALLSTAI